MHISQKEFASSNAKSLMKPILARRRDEGCLEWNLNTCVWGHPCLKSIDLDVPEREKSL